MNSYFEYRSGHFIPEASISEIMVHLEDPKADGSDRQWIVSVQVGKRNELYNSTPFNSWEDAYEFARQLAYRISGDVVSLPEFHKRGWSAKSC